MRIESGPDTVKEIEVRRIARVMDWGVQLGMWGGALYFNDIIAIECRRQLEFG
ncbi:hypothetical protein N9B88_03410 [Rubripirellula sp.]|nr:hypothetical protein [Rubripirellula sp.]